jgi:hypothetical protein
MESANHISRYTELLVQTLVFALLASQSALQLTQNVRYASRLPAHPVDHRTGISFRPRGTLICIDMTVR